MTKIIIPVIITGIIIVGVIMGLIMMNTHPSLAEIVENKDCQELGKFDQRMDEIYGYDVKKAKAELNISDELFSKATKLGVNCAFDTVSSMHSNNLVDEDDSKNEKQMNMVIGAIQNRDCQSVLDWIDVYGYASDVGFSSKELEDIINYKEHCEDPNTILDENGIDIEEGWYLYFIWDRK